METASPVVGGLRCPRTLGRRRRRRWRRRSIPTRWDRRSSPGKWRGAALAPRRLARPRRRAVHHRRTRRRRWCRRTIRKPRRRQPSHLRSLLRNQQRWRRRIRIWQRQRSRSTQPRRHRQGPRVPKGDRWIRRLARQNRRRTGRWRWWGKRRHLRRREPGAAWGQWSGHRRLLLVCSALDVTPR